MNIAMELELIRLKLAQVEITGAEIRDETLIVDLADGRTISVPIVWFPRLSYGTSEERNNFKLFRDSIYWPDLDEDIGVNTLLLGRGRGESSQSLQHWLQQRQKLSPHCAP